MNYINEIGRFAKHYESVQTNENADLIDANGMIGNVLYCKAAQDINFVFFTEYSSGYYLRHFAKGIDNALEDYYNEISRLEYFYEKPSVNSLVHIYNALQQQLPTIHFLRKLIKNVRIQV